MMRSRRGEPKPSRLLVVRCSFWRPESRSAPCWTGRKPMEQILLNCAHSQLRPSPLFASMAGAEVQVESTMNALTALVTALRKSRRRGFTMIEIMISVLIMIVGLVGIFAMQIVAIQANASSRDVTEALGVAEHFIGTL
ncbi:MAG: hypothetical protein CO108_01215, partial [Deltaproteobacteria bacterium CG_4_9_14_3_um_filter_63_12]